MTVDVMVAPDKLADFFDLMNVLGTSYEKFIDNVQDLIDSEMPKEQLASLNGFSLNTYHTIEEIYEHLDNLARDHSDKVQIIVGGSSYEGRQIKGVKLSLGKNKPGIVIEGGIHAREWISPATVLYIIDRLLNSADSEISSLAKAYDWYIFPSVNPDGYVYTHTKVRFLYIIYITI